MKANNLKKGYMSLGNLLAPLALAGAGVFSPLWPLKQPRGTWNKAVPGGSSLIEELVGRRGIPLQHVKCPNQAWPDWRGQIAVWRLLPASSSRAVHTWRDPALSPSGCVRNVMSYGVGAPGKACVMEWEPQERDVLQGGNPLSRDLLLPNSPEGSKHARAVEARLARGRSRWLPSHSPPSPPLPSKIRLSQLRGSS